MPGLEMPSISGLPVALMGSPGSPNPNLLLWSEALDNAVWTKSGAVVTANAAVDPDGEMTAESVAFNAFGTLTQTTTVAASAGSDAQSLITPTGSLGRFSVSGTFDGTDYVLSLYVKNAGSDLQVTLKRSGGFLCAEFQDGGDGATFTIAWTKLETPDLTAYVKREGS